MSDAVLERFHRALIEEIQTQRPEYLTAAFTVAEIYQNLVPYGSHRDRIGVEMNGDYEDALVRLLAGEGGYLILDSEPALKKLRAELDRANPNTAIYREYAAVDVRLNQAYLDLSSLALDDLPDLAEELDAETPVTMAALAPAEGFSDRLGIVPPGVDIFDDVGRDDARSDRARSDDAGSEGRLGEDLFTDDGASRRTSGARARPRLEPEFVEPPSPPAAPAAPAVPVSAAPSVARECKWCRGDLPARETVNFCPHCGTDLALVPCRSCGEEIEPGWRFCASCGTAVAE